MFFGLLIGALTMVAGVVMEEAAIVIGGALMIAGGIIGQKNQQIGAMIANLGVVIATAGMGKALKEFTKLKLEPGSAGYVVSSAISSIKSSLDSVVKPIADSIDWLNDGLDYLQKDVLEGAFGEIDKFTSNLSTIYQFADAASDFQSGNEVRGLFKIFTTLDDRIAEAGKNGLQYIDDSLYRVVSEVRRTFDIVNGSINYINNQTMEYEKYFDTISRGFNVAGIGDIADGLRIFREDTLHAFHNSINKLRGDILSQFNVIMNPVERALHDAIDVSRLSAKSRGIMQYASLSILSDGWLPKAPAGGFFVPVMRRL